MNMAPRMSSLLYCSLLLVLSNGAAKKTLQPHALQSLAINSTKNEGKCTYTVSIRTSCLSARYTRDQISLAFGDAYGNQVYAPRLDEPHTRTFERCSGDRFEVYGPCTYQICYVYVYRSGYDGWRPKTITISGYYTKPVTFSYSVSVPSDVWFGFNHCASYLASSLPGEGVRGVKSLDGFGVI